MHNVILRAAVIGIILLFTIVSGSFGGPAPKAFISGEIKDIDSGTVEIFVQDNYNEDTGITVITKIQKGKFELAIPGIKEISIFYLYINDILFPKKTRFWVDSGDSIHMFCVGDSMRFSGRGSKKCEMAYELKRRLDAIKITAGRYHAEGIEKHFAQCNSVMSEVFAKYRSYFSRFNYNIIKAGEFGISEAWLFIGMNHILALAERDKRYNMDSTVRVVSAVVDRRLQAARKLGIVANDSLTICSDFIDYVVKARAVKEYIKQITTHDNDPERIWHGYQSIRSDYTGKFRDRMVSRYFFSMLAGLDLFSEEEFKVVQRCYRDYMKTGRTSVLKKITKKRFDEIKAIAPGTVAYNFCLKDTAGKKWCLSDLKGKVVVLDFWFTGCAPCAQLSIEMNKIIEDFKLNDSVVFVSISSTYDRDLWIRGMGKGRGKFNGGEGLQLQIPKDSTDRILKAYAVSGFPALRMIDRDGKIFISTVPLPGPRTDEFLEKLRNALAKPASN